MKLLKEFAKLKRWPVTALGTAAVLNAADAVVDFAESLAKVIWDQACETVGQEEQSEIPCGEEEPEELRAASVKRGKNTRAAISKFIAGGSFTAGSLNSSKWAEDALQGLQDLKDLLANSSSLRPNDAARITITLNGYVRRAENVKKTAELRLNDAKVISSDEFATAKQLFLIQKLERRGYATKGKVLRYNLDGTVEIQWSTDKASIETVPRNQVQIS